LIFVIDSVTGQNETNVINIFIEFVTFSSGRYGSVEKHVFACIYVVHVMALKTAGQMAVMVILIISCKFINVRVVK
jgi:hypothetical protein